MAAFVDTLRDRWDGITPRERNLVMLLGASFILCVIIYLATSIQSGLGALEAKNARTRRALLVLADLRARGELNASHDDATVIPAEPVKLESYLTKAATKVGITIPSYNPRPSATKNGFSIHAGQVELRDLTITQLKDLLEAIESDSKVVVITSLSVSRNFRDKQKVDLKLDIATYAKPEAGAGGGSGSGSAGAGAGAAAGAGKGS